MPDDLKPPCHILLNVHTYSRCSPVFSFNVTRPYRSGVNAITIDFNFRYELRKRVALHETIEILSAANISWLRPLSSPAGRWLVDLDAMKQWAGKTAKLIAWASGRAALSPIFETMDSNRYDSDHKECRVRFEYPDDTDPESAPMFFPELQPALDKFQLDHGDLTKTAFVMMRFMDTDLQTKAFEAVVETCKQVGVTALRADGKQYADELLPNIRTYMHGCGFGIAIFERITTDDFNPNVSLEVGYMMALGKPVCLLKDSTLKSLHTDLVGGLYESFNPQSPETSLPARLTKWMQDKGIAPTGS